MNVKHQNPVKSDLLAINNAGSTFLLSFTIKNILSYGDVSKIIIDVNGRKGFLPF